MSYPTARLLRNSIIFVALLSLTIAFVPRGASVSAISEKHVAQNGPATTPKQNVSKDFGNLPLTFEPNHGQTKSRFKFLSRGSGYRLFLSATDAMLALSTSDDHSQLLRMRIVGGNANGKVTGENKLRGKSNYLIGDRRNWKVDLPTYGGVRVEQVYRGIDLVYYGADQRRLEYDFVVAPGADPKTIRLAFEGVDELKLAEDGSLHLNTKAGEVVQPAPFIYQELNGERHQVAGRYVVDAGNNVTFAIAEYDRTRKLIIDPQLVYQSFHGGLGEDEAFGIAVDLNGNAYVVGTTISADLNQTGPLQGPQGNTDAFVVKIDPTGSQIIYSTYLGSTDQDSGHAIAVTKDGRACITGSTDTDGSNFPTLNGYQEDGLFSSDKDTFVTMLTASGNGLFYSSLLGGRESEKGNGIAVDAANNIYVTGVTNSNNFPTKHAFQNRDLFIGAFVAKFNPNERRNDSLVYSSLLGGHHGHDFGHGIAVTPAGVAFVTGRTESNDFPVKSSSSLPPFQATFGGGESDGFVAKVSPSGDLIYSTYFGGDGLDIVDAIAVDANERAYVTGVTLSSRDTFPLKNAFDTTDGASSEAFVAKFNADGTTLFYSSFISGTDLNNQGEGIAVDAGGNAYVTGVATDRAQPFPVINGFPQNFERGNTFIVKIGPSNATGTNVPTIVYSDSVDSGFPRFLALDQRGNVYIAGVTFAPRFTTPGVFQETFSGGSDAVVLKISSTVPDTFGLFRPAGNLFLLRNSNSAGTPDQILEFGETGDLPVSGDWDGNGVTDIGVFRPSRGEFLLRLPDSTITINFGIPGDLPVAGDWNGDGIDTPGVFRPGPVGSFLLTNTIADQSAPVPDFVFNFGLTGDLPVAGDWNGDTVDTVGVFRSGSPSAFFLANELQAPPDIIFTFGTKGDLPLVGDWFGLGKDTIGVYRPGKPTMLMGDNFTNIVDLSFTVPFGQSIDLPLAGNWDGQ